MESLVRASSEIESATLRGGIAMVDWILTGGLDESAREVLGLKDPDPEPAEPYMAYDEEELGDGTE